VAVSKIKQSPGFISGCMQCGTQILCECLYFIDLDTYQLLQPIMVHIIMRNFRILLLLFL